MTSLQMLFVKRFGYSTFVVGGFKTFVVHIAHIHVELVFVEQFAKDVLLLCQFQLLELLHISLLRFDVDVVGKERLFLHLLPNLQYRLHRFLLHRLL